MAFAVAAGRGRKWWLSYGRPAFVLTTFRAVGSYVRGDPLSEERHLFMRSDGTLVSDDPKAEPENAMYHGAVAALVSSGRRIRYDELRPSDLGLFNADEVAGQLRRAIDSSSAV